MALRLRLPLKVKLSLLITGLVVLSVVVIGVILVRQEQASLTLEMTKRGLTIAENLAAAAKSAIVTDDDLTLNVLIRDAMRDPDVSYVAITDEDGSVRAHSDVAMAGKPVVRPPGLEKTGDEVEVRTWKAKGAPEVIDFAVPLVYSSVRVGSLYVGFSKQSITTALSHARNRAGVVTIAMVLLGIGGAVALAQLMARPIFRLREATRAVAQGNFDVTVPVTSADEIGDLSESFNQMVRALHEKEMIKRAFTRYVAREVVDEILKDPERMVLTGARSKVTVLFCDLRGFTRMSERMSPEAVVMLLNEFYTLMIETVFKYDGTLDKFLGDAVMAVFGAPIAPHPDHTLRALRTALEMQTRVGEWNDTRRAEGREAVPAGVGVTVGEVVAGTVGTEDRMEYTVIGDSVNLAARLESMAKGGQVLISEAAYAIVGDLVLATSLGRIKVKGKEEEVEVYEVHGMREAAL